MLTTDQAKHLHKSGGNVIDIDGNMIGRIGQVFADDQTGRPEWVTVDTGMFGGGESFVPLRGADATGDDLRVAHFGKEVQGAPRISDSGGHLSEEEEATLYAYYGEDGADYDTSYGVSDAEARGDGEHHDAVHGSSDSAVLGSDEQHVGRWTYETGRTRLRRYVSTGEAVSTGGKPIRARQ